MKLHIEGISHSLQWLHHLPRGYRGPVLPGSEAVAASGSFGSLQLQEYDGGSFCLRYSVVRTEEPLSLQVQSTDAGLHGILMLKNGIEPDIQNCGLVKIGQGQFAFIHGVSPSACVEFGRRQDFICLEVVLRGELSSWLLREFPEVAGNQDGSLPAYPDLLVRPGARGDDEVRKHIHFLFSYSERERWQRSYFERRVMDLSWKLFTLHINENKALGFDPLETEKARLLKKIVLDNLHDHIMLKELAQQVNCSESTIKRVFKKFFGLPIHQFRIHARVHRADQLIEGGMNVNEAAAEVGWDAEQLIAAYWKCFGTTPGTKKVKQPGK